MYIPEQEVRAALTYESLIPAIRQALIDYSAGLVEQPARTILRAGNAEGFRNGWFAVMPVIAGDVMGVKTVTFYPGNAAAGLHTHLAVIELLSRATGEPLAVMDGRLITEMRTAAVSAVALDALAPKHAPSLGILGSGVQARSHLEAFRRVRPELKDIRIWSRTGANAERLAAVSLYLALMTEACLGLIGAKGTIFVEGPFALNHAYLVALSALTSADVVALAGSTGTSQGAALLTGIRPPATTENKPVRAELPGLIRYRQTWREALNG